MSSAGFSTVFSVMVGIVLLALVVIVLGAVSRGSKERNIERQMDALKISASLEDKTCSAGDPVDSPEAWCEYKYTDTGNQVQDALRQAGFTAGSSTTEDGVYAKTIKTIFTGGDPVLTVDVESSNGKTSMTARLAHE